jgi:hypothetical protein
MLRGRLSHAAPKWAGIARVWRLPHRADVLLAARIVLIVVPLSGAFTSRSLAPIDTVQEINRCLTAVRVAVSRRHTEERGGQSVRLSAVYSDRT